MININMTKAREIKKQRIREERVDLFEKLDADFMRAIEGGDNEAQADIAAKKTALRDATDDPAIEAATTAEELSAVRPSILDHASPHWRQNNE